MDEQLGIRSVFHNNGPNTESKEILKMENDIFSTFTDVQNENPDELIYPSLFSFTDVSGNAAPEPSVNGQDESANDSLSLTPTERMSTEFSDTLNNNFIKLESNPPGSLEPTMCYDAPFPITNKSTAESNLSFIHSLSANTPDKKKPLTNFKSTGNTSEPSSANGSSTSKPKPSSRKNAWGNLSYADLITQAIESSPDRRLTLAQIYDWVVKNIDHFKDKGDSNSSAGWKNSIRHNLSLHHKFKRVQNEGTGKSSWWMINYDAKPNKPSRRRTTSMETNNMLKKSRDRALMKKKEAQLKKQQLKKQPSSDVAAGDCDSQRNSSVYSDFRPRTQSDATGIGGQVSPPKSRFLHELEPTDPSALSPIRLSSSYTPSSAFDRMERKGDLDVNYNTDNLLELIENMDLIPGQANEATGVYYNQASSSQQQHQANSCSSSCNSLNDFTSGPSSLLQARTNQGSTPNIRLLISQNPQQNMLLSNVDNNLPGNRARSKTEPRLPHQIKTKLLARKANFNQNGGRPMQRTVFMNNSNPRPVLVLSQNNLGQFQYNEPQQQQFQSNNQPQFQQQGFVQQQRQSNEGNFNGMNTKTQWMEQTPAQQQGASLNMFPDSSYPSDLNSIDQNDIFNPGSLDMNGVLEGFNPMTVNDLGDFDFGTCFSQEDVSLSDMDNIGGNPGLTELESNDFQAYSYPNNQTFMSSGSRSSSSDHGVQYQNLNTIENGQSQLLTVLNTPPNGTMLLENGALSSNVPGFSNHFDYPHQTKMDEVMTSVPAEFHMR